MPDTLPEFRVLIGVANPVEREGLEKRLRGWGHSVESVEDGGRAWERLSMPEPAAVALLDYDLPGLNCVEICKALRTSKAASATGDGVSSIVRAFETSLTPCGPLEGPTRIIAMLKPSAQEHDFASSDSAKIASALDAGVSEIVLKPAREWELHLRLQTAQEVLGLRSELKKSTEAVAFQASHDPLTGLWNRETALSLFFQETERAKRGRSPLSIILVDLDHFAQRSLEFGYEVCNSVLQQVAVRLRRQLRSYDILGRSGEDEYLVILPGCSFEDALAMAERLRGLAMHFPFYVKRSSLTVRASFGVAESRGRLPLLVLREAERALTAAKLAGRDRVRSFTSELLHSSALSRFSPKVLSQGV
jgi:two-component system, cell cycle response regulator